MAERKNERWRVHSKGNVPAICIAFWLNPAEIGSESGKVVGKRFSHALLLSGSERFKKTEKQGRGRENNPHIFSSALHLVLLFCVKRAGFLFYSTGLREGDLPVFI